MSGAAPTVGAELVSAIDHAAFTRKQKIFVAALLAALVFDYMKPFTLSFVIPGVRATWGLAADEASYLAVAGLTGTVVGSLFWGYMADRIGRKRTLLWTVGILTAASLCGLSTEFWHTLAFCFAMGFGVGGEAPIVFALATEYLPVRVRGQAVLFIGIMGIVAGYAAEVFPTPIRTRRSGVVAGAGKFGGVVGPYLGGLWLGAGGSSLGLQIPLAVSLFVAAAVLAVAGVETRNRALEQIGG
jgi:MFS family permease